MLIQGFGSSNSNLQQSLTERDKSINGINTHSIISGKYVSLTNNYTWPNFTQVYIWPKEGESGNKANHNHIIQEMNMCMKYM